MKELKIFNLNGRTYEIVDAKAREQIEELGQPSVKYARSIEECIDTSKMYVLPDGYIYAYTSHEEELIDILKDVGYTTDMRVNSSGDVVSWTSSDADVTGFVEVKSGDVIRMKNIVIPSEFTSGTYWQQACVYDENKNFIKKINLVIDDDGVWEKISLIVENGNVTGFTLVESEFGSNIAYLIINAKEISEDSEVYVSSANTIMQGWENTGLAFSLDNDDGNNMPSYWLDEINTKTETIQLAVESAGRNKSAFLWYTDAHWTSNSKMSPVLLAHLCKNTPINKVNFGGDIIGDPSEYTHENIKYAYEWRKLISNLPNHHSVIGNHDANHNTTDVSNIAYSFLNAPEESCDMVVGGDFYYYIDNPSEKTRYIYLSYLTNDHTEMMAQGQFIVNALLNAPENWHIVAIAHRWFQYTSSSAPTVGSVPQYEAEILQIFDEYNARTTHTASNYFESQDFAEGKAKVEFCIGGHIHADYDFKTDSGIPIIITTSDTNQERVSDSDTDCGVSGTITESAVYAIVADYDNNKINVIGIGRGNSREIGC